MRCTALFVVLFTLTACSSADIERGRVVLDEFKQLQPDASLSYRVPPGTYKLK